MGTKHGVWFDLLDHLAIHKQVLNRFDWMIKSGAKDYSIVRIDHKSHSEIGNEIEFTTVNDFKVKISKKTITSSEKPPKFGKTNYFSYNCFEVKGIYRLQYHSAHDFTYNPNSPWHDRPHKHEYDSKIQKIDIYSFDHRPEADRNKKYYNKDGEIHINFLGHEDWPFISEFLQEVCQL